MTQAVRPVGAQVRSALELLKLGIVADVLDLRSVDEGELARLEKEGQMVKFVPGVGPEMEYRMGGDSNGRRR